MEARTPAYEVPLPGYYAIRCTIIDVANEIEQLDDLSREDWERVEATYYLVRYEDYLYWSDREKLDFVRSHQGHFFSVKGRVVVTRERYVGFTDLAIAILWKLKFGGGSILPPTVQKCQPA